ncbi:hypothetical protein KIN20_003211 [Parelaphostrongylus tenuis]|uniref:Uncharacterized protein n=1 Tax=Parelaphostrongylus tenuis TaxID=148309 RepID=A0AAD5M0Z8_PARTN|nr:hypothetical protein KIN20_003211 [Parelaphostrongylus tenuis]
MSRVGRRMLNSSWKGSGSNERYCSIDEAARPKQGNLQNTVRINDTFVSYETNLRHGAQYSKEYGITKASLYEGLHIYDKTRAKGLTLTQRRILHSVNQLTALRFRSFQ